MVRFMGPSGANQHVSITSKWCGNVQGSASAWSTVFAVMFQFQNGAIYDPNGATNRNFECLIPNGGIRILHGSTVYFKNFLVSIPKMVRL